jgi:hypothetical protein
LAKKSKKAPQEEEPSTSDEGTATGAPGPDLSSRLKRGARTYRFAISIAVAVIGWAIFFLGLLAYTPIGATGPLSPIEQSLLGGGCSGGPNYVNGACTSTAPNWTLAMLPAGGILGLIGTYLAITYEVARRRFEHLMKTKSKAEFLRNVIEAEDLLWDLTPEDEIRLVRKKQELKIRT